MELTATFPNPGTVYGSDPCGLAMQMVIDEGQPMALAVIGLSFISFSARKLGSWP